MPETPRRKRLQIHLSTAVVMMIAAGVLIWANVREGKRVPPDVAPQWKYGKETVYGWPIVAANGGDSDVPPRFYHKFFSWKLAANAFVAVSILVVVWFVCEW